ncbi:MAG: sensor histidine kinase [Phycisphaerales bacterium]
MNTLPLPVAAYLASLARVTMRPACARVSSDGRVIEVPSTTEEWTRYADAAPTVGSLIDDAFPVAAGLFPAGHEPTVIPQCELAPGVFVDVHAANISGQSWLILIDVSETSARQQAIQSRANETELLKHELARQNTALAHAKQAAEDANQAKTVFLASMTHELRTPLQSIIGYSSLLIDDAKEWGPGAATAGDDLKTINAAGKHLLVLINDLLDMAKAEAGKIELHIETFDAAAVIEDTLRAVKPMAEKNGNRLVSEVRAEGLKEMISDMTRVRQVLFNLLSNACKFTQEGTVTLRAGVRETSAGPWLRLDVVDSGIGMTPEQLGKLFQPFQQADSSTTKKFGGTGLGLSIVRKLCRLMGGEVEAASQPGQGSTFSVDLPMVYVAPDPMP